MDPSFSQIEPSEPDWYEPALLEGAVFNPLEDLSEVSSTPVALGENTEQSAIEGSDPVENSVAT